MEIDKLKSLFGATLRAKRMGMGLSQEDFAGLVGLHRTYIGQIERGERNISLKNILIITEKLEMEISAFFENIEKLGRKSMNE